MALILAMSQHTSPQRTSPRRSGFPFSEPGLAAEPQLASDKNAHALEFFAKTNLEMRKRQDAARKKQEAAKKQSTNKAKGKARELGAAGIEAGGEEEEEEEVEEIERAPGAYTAKTRVVKPIPAQKKQKSTDNVKWETLITYPGRLKNERDSDCLRVDRIAHEIYCKACNTPIGANWTNVIAHLGIGKGVTNTGARHRKRYKQWKAGQNTFKLTEEYVKVYTCMCVFACARVMELSRSCVFMHCMRAFARTRTCTHIHMYILCARVGMRAQDQLHALLFT
jgi:hypothetical protein